MKKIVILLAAFFCVISNSFATDEKLTLTPSEDKTYVDFVLEGERIYTAFQIDKLALPAGYSLDTNKGVLETAFDYKLGIIPCTTGHDGNKSTTYSLGINTNNDGSYTLSLNSSKNAQFTAKSGIVLRMYIKKAGSASSSQANISATGISFIYLKDNGTEEKVAFTDTYCSLNGNALPGDVNHDGSINKVDVTATADKALGKTDSTFNATEGDIDGNGVINIVDVTKIINLCK